jgi:hypothetical protein
MGTSGSYGGPAGGTPLIPTWLDPPTLNPAPPATSPLNPAQPNIPAPGVPPPPIPAAPPNVPLPPMGSPERFARPRADFSRFVASGGSDRASLGRALSGYVSSASGGARRAAQRMGSSRQAGARLLNFLSDVQRRGVQEALRALDLQALAGRPIEEVFLGLADYVCPAGGTVDEGIARDAFIETIADLADLGISELGALTPDQMHTVFEIYATHAIEARIANDIGTKSIVLPADVRAVARVEAQLHDFIRRGVSDALAAAVAAVGALTQNRILGFVDGVYEAAFDMLQTLAEAAEAA